MSSAHLKVVTPAKYDACAPTAALAVTHNPSTLNAHAPHTKPPAKDWGNHRERLGLCLDDAAALLKCDRSKVSRLETGQRGIRRDDLDLLLDEYAVTGAERAALVALTPGRRRSGFGYGFQRFRDDLKPGFGDYLMLESLASAIAVYSPLQVPDLLQTPGYTRAIAKAGAGRTIVMLPGWCCAVSSSAPGTRPRDGWDPDRRGAG